jgi:hypothetical protein
MCFVLAPDIFFSIVSKRAGIVSLKSNEEFQKQGHVEVTSCPVLPFHSALQGTAPIRNSFILLPSPCFLSLTPIPFPHVVKH